MAANRVSETQLMLPALYFINREPGITTSRIKSLLVDLLKPTGKDAEIARNRSDTYFEQKVRNLVSHRTLQRLGYAEYEKMGNDGIHTITDLFELPSDDTSGKECSLVSRRIEVSCCAGPSFLVFTCTVKYATVKPKPTLVPSDEFITLMIFQKHCPGRFI